MISTVNYTVCTAIFAWTHPCDTNTFTHNFTGMYLLLLKMHSIWIGFFWNQNFPFRHNRNSNLKVIYIINFNKTNIGVSSFLLGSSSKDKKIQNFFASNSFYLFWNARFSNRCHFILLTVFLLEKSHILYTSTNNRQYSYFQFFCFTA